MRSVTKFSAPYNSNFRKKIRSKTQDGPSAIRTCGEVFPDGAIIELVQKNGILNLFVFDRKHRTIVPELQFRGRLFGLRH